MKKGNKAGASKMLGLDNHKDFWKGRQTNNKTYNCYFYSITLAPYFIQDPDHHQHSNLAIIDCDDSFNWLNQKTSVISVKQKFQQQCFMTKRWEMSVCKRSLIAWFWAFRALLFVASHGEKCSAGTRERNGEREIFAARFCINVSLHH